MIGIERLRARMIAIDACRGSELIVERRQRDNTIANGARRAHDHDDGRVLRGASLVVRA
ncbi:MAG: hypothetical protein NCW75_00640 [Phycisphaera sp.]|nr:MAG: hypothetical protein NCW75_00640 [Phycisphaera sp.]